LLHQRQALGGDDITTGQVKIFADRDALEV
jgi:hypothetical protein